MRPARVPSASPSGRSTRPPAIACASSSSMKRPASRSPPSTKAAATRWPRASTSSLRMRSSKRSRSRAPTPSRSTDLCRTPRSTSASSIAPYYVMPSEPVGQEAFALIREAMRGKGMVALGRLVLSKRERVIALEPYDKGLLGTTLRYPYEVRKAEDYFCDLPDLTIAPDMLTLAEHILDSKASEFDSATFRDRYEEALLAHLKARQAGAVPERRKTFAPPHRVVNLMEALRRSVAEDIRGAAARKGPSATPARKRA